MDGENVIDQKNICGTDGFLSSQSCQTAVHNKPRRRPPRRVTMTQFNRAGD